MQLASGRNRMTGRVHHRGGGGTCTGVYYHVRPRVVPSASRRYLGAATATAAGVAADALNQCRLLITQSKCAN